MKAIRLPSIRSRLALLVTACVLPALLMAVALINADYQHQREQMLRDAIGTGRAMSFAVDSDLASVVSALRALATSPNLTRGDLPAFHRQAREVLETQKQNINNILLTDAAGQQHLNTARPYGTALPMSGNLSHVRRVFDTGEADISDLFVGAVVKTPIVSIAVPVRRGDTIIYSMAATISPQRLLAMLARQQLPPDWIGVIVDGSGTILARTRDMERFAGTKATPALLERLQASAEGSLETESVEGIPVLLVYSRSSVSHWTVGIGIPLGGFAGKLQASLRQLIAGTALLFLCTLGLALFIGKGIGASVHALIAPALALGKGEAVVLSDLPLKEADAVGKALMKASRMLAEARHQAHHDVLTGLANRGLLREILDQQIALCERTGANLTILYMDLDGFKAVNDQYGHTIGDELLLAVAIRLRQGIRASDVAARLGGDEFAALLVHSGVAASGIVAGKLVKGLSLPYELGALTLEISVSIGAATYPGSGHTGEALLQAADRAMYAAKLAGKRHYVLG